MKSETYWPQEKLYFYATCTLFPGKLLASSLSSQQFKEYIPYFWSVDEQIEQLASLKQEGLLDFTTSRIDDDNTEYTFTQVNSDGFISILKEYLARYRNDELIEKTKYKFADNNDRLIKYTTSSTRDEPTVNPTNIWDDWTYFNSPRFPFWEVVLTYQLLEDRGEITALGYSIHHSNTYQEEAWPSVSVRVFNKEAQQNRHKSQRAIKHKVGIVVTPAGKLQVIIDGKRTTIQNYKSEKNDTYRAARAMYDAKGKFLARSELNLNPNSRTLVKNLISNMGIKGILTDLFIEYGDNSTVSLRRHATADEYQFKQLLIYVKTFEQKNR